jgi:hypothetical protein
MRIASIIGYLVLLSGTESMYIQGMCRIIIVDR